MNDLQLVGCTTLLTQRKTYQIDGTLYRYLYSTDSIKHPNYIFRPLPQQKKTADLKLNRDKVLRRVYEVPALYAHGVFHVKKMSQPYYNEYPTTPTDQQTKGWLIF